MKLSKRLLSKTVAVAAVFATMATAAFAAPQGTFDTSEIQITGEASRSVAPNYAILTLGITSENTNINAAKSNNDRIMSDLISKLGHLGIDKKDIYTSNISINPTNDYQDGKRINTGYSVANRVTVKINNDVSQQLSDSLTTEAIQDGRHKAEVIAAALGRTLGPVKTVSISTPQTSSMDSGSYRNALMLKASLETATPVEKGSLVVSQDANITYYLQ